MNDYLAMGLIFFALISLGLFRLFSGRHTQAKLRKLPPFEALKKAHIMTLESGQKLFLAVGSNLFSNEISISGIIGLHLTKKLFFEAALSDQVPICVSGEGELAALSKRLVAGVYHDTLAPTLLNRDRSHLAGCNTSAYVAACLVESNEKGIGEVVLAGQFKPVMALITDQSSQAHIFTLAGCESPATQATFFCNTKNVLLGEEYYALALTGKNPRLATTSLRVQDLIRILLIITIIIGAILKAFGIIL